MAAKHRGKREGPKTSTARRREAVKLLRTLAERETEPGAKGYSLGMAERIEEGDPVTEAYLERLRRAVAAGDEGDKSAAGPAQGGS
jgi:hypothetical protein